MIFKEWENLPDEMRIPEIKKYYIILKSKRKSLYIKRLFDIVLSLIILIVLLPIFFIISIAIKLDSEGPIMFRQLRITQYGNEFKIFKFRTMVENAEKLGAQLTQKEDKRITKVGSFLRKYRLDETPQIINIFLGDMTFVGTRPEIKKYVELYTNEMLATLLLPAGLTSEASIRFKDEDKLLKDALDIDTVYINEILPNKIKYNLEDLKEFSLMRDIKIMVKTFLKVFFSR